MVDAQKTGNKRVVVDYSVRTLEEGRLPSRPGHGREHLRLRSLREAPLLPPTLPSWTVHEGKEPPQGSPLSDLWASGRDLGVQRRGSPRDVGPEPKERGTRGDEDLYDETPVAGDLGSVIPDPKRGA